MAFGVATVVTTVGKSIMADRVGNASTYTTVPKWCAMGTGATGAARTASASDTALSTELAGVARAVGVVTASTNVYQVVGPAMTSVSGPNAIDEAGLFDALTVGHMFTSATQNVVTLNTGDSIVWTWQVTFS
jgi:hypothetical protein